MIPIHSVVPLRSCSLMHRQRQVRLVKLRQAPPRDCHNNRLRYSAKQDQRKIATYRPSQVTHQTNLSDRLHSCQIWISSWKALASILTSLNPRLCSPTKNLSIRLPRISHIYLWTISCPTFSRPIHWGVPTWPLEVQAGSGRLSC